MNAKGFDFDAGWVILPRSIQKSGIYPDPVLLAIYVHCMLTANFEDSETMIGGELVTIQRGEFITSRQSLAKTFDLHESRIERLLKILRSADLIKWRTKKRLCRIIEVIGYDEMQKPQKRDYEQPIEHQIEQPLIPVKSPGRGQQIEQQTEQRANNDRTLYKERKEFKELEKKQSARANPPKKQKTENTENLKKRKTKELAELRDHLTDKLSKPQKIKLERQIKSLVEEIERLERLPLKTDEGTSQMEMGK
jgi:hypothetical protein